MQREMITTDQLQKRSARVSGWVVLFALGLLMVVNIVVVLLEGGASQFVLDTGVSWNEFAAAYPGIAATYTLSQRLMFLYFAALGLFTMVIAYFGLRSGRRWAWYILWLLPAILVLTALLTAQSRRPEIGVLYGGFALWAVIGLLLSGRGALRKHVQREGIVP